MLKYEDVIKLETSDIEKQVFSLRKELFNLKMQKKAMGLEAPHRLKIIRRDVARLLTAKNSKKVIK